MARIPVGKINRCGKTKTLSQTVTKQRCILTTMISWQAQIPKRQMNHKYMGS